MKCLRHCLLLLFLFITAVFPYTIQLQSKDGEAVRDRTQRGMPKVLSARQMAFVRDCDPNQERIIIAAARRLSHVVLEAVIASERRILDSDRELRAIFDYQFLQNRPHPRDDQVSVHYILQRVWDEAYFTTASAEDNQPLTAPGNRCRGSRPLYITNNRGADGGTYAGGDTIVICGPFYRLPMFDVSNPMERDQLWFLFEAFALNSITAPQPLGALVPNYYGRRTAFHYYVYAKDFSGIFKQRREIVKIQSQRPWKKPST